MGGDTWSRQQKDQASGCTFQSSTRESLRSLGKCIAKGRVHDCQIQKIGGEELTLRRPRLVKQANIWLIEKSRPLF